MFEQSPVEVVAAIESYYPKGASGGNAKNARAAAFPAGLRFRTPDPPHGF